jgi:hypothetical protein
MDEDGHLISEGFIKVISIHKYEHNESLSKVMKLKNVTSQPLESMRLTYFLQKNMNIKDAELLCDKQDRQGAGGDTPQDESAFKISLFSQKDSMDHALERINGGLDML